VARDAIALWGGDGMDFAQLAPTWPSRPSRPSRSPLRSAGSSTESPSCTGRPTPCRSPAPPPGSGR
jgi:hypothetical protein